MAGRDSCCPEYYLGWPIRKYIPETVPCCVIHEMRMFYVLNPWVLGHFLSDLSLGAEGMGKKDQMLKSEWSRSATRELQVVSL